jgi:hypothetical protein
MFPVGAVAGLAAASAARQPSRTKAHVLGGRYALQQPGGSERGLGAFAIAWTLGLTALWIAVPPKQGEDWIPLALAAFVALPLAPAMVEATGRHFVFDDQGMEVISPWRRAPLRLAWRDLIEVHHTGSSLRFRTRSRQKVRVPQQMIGLATLAWMVTRAMPSETVVNAKTRNLLLSLAQVEGP